MIRRLRQGAPDDLQRGVGRVHRLDLMLVEPAHLHAAISVHMPVHDGQRACDHLGEGRLARAVDAEEANAVVDVEAQVQLLEYGFCVIADAGVLQPDQRRRQRAGRRGQGEGRDPLLHRQGDRLQLGQALHAGLGLRGLGGLGAEAVHEGLQVSALGVLLDLGRLGEAGLLRPRGLEVVVAARVEIEPPLRQVQNHVDRIVQQFPVVADDDRRVRILLQPRLEPKGAFEVEVVGRLVQQKEVRLREQGGG